MKSVIASCILLALLIGFCFFVKTRTQTQIDVLYEMTEEFPRDIASYKASSDGYLAQVRTLGDRWSDAVGYFSYVCTYNLINRADEAVWNLYAAVETGDHPAAIAARYQLLDALRRMRELESVTVSSIF